MQIKSYALTDIGQVRDKNEDNYYNDPTNNLFVVCDGVGGHLGGEIASQMVVNVFKDNPGKDLCGLIETANQQIYSRAQQDASLCDMATTIVLLNINKENCYIAHVGDSRIYHINQDVITQLTQDHSWVQEQVNFGVLTQEQAKNHYSKHIITRAIGVESEVDIDSHTMDIEPGTYLLCTDGLSDHVEDHKIKDIILSCGDNLEASARSLVSEAKLCGSEDNITVLLVRT